MTMTRKPYEYLSSHPWLTFSVDLTHASASLWTALGECHSKCEHIAGVPLRPDIAEILHAVYLAKGVGGTTAIEGNTLSEEEVLKHVQGKLEVPPSKEYLKQEIDNILQEQNRMLERIFDRKPLTLSVVRIRDINKTVLRGLSLEDEVVPGEIRTHSVGVMTYKGAPWRECEYLLAKLCDWLNGSDFEPRAGLSAGQMAILKAILAHLYIEWIHPFGDGNGRTGRLVEVQILLASGVPSPACQLLSNHYNKTRKLYLTHLKEASESGGKVLPFLEYALSGFLEGLREQLAYIRKLQMQVAWINYVHETFGRDNTKASERQKHLLLDVFEYEEVKHEEINISDIDHLSPRLAKAYANMHPRTCLRDIETLEKLNFLIRDGKKIRANTALISRFLPLRAEVRALQKSKRLKTSAPSISLPPPSSQLPAAATGKVS
jgi:Fic family protein